MFKDNIFKNIENKTNIKKETILSLANKLQKNNFKDEKTIREIIQELSDITGKKVSKEQEQKIINSIANEKIPKNIEKFF